MSIDLRPASDGRFYRCIFSEEELREAYKHE